MNELDRLRAAYPALAVPDPPAATVARLDAAYARAERRFRWPSRRVGFGGLAAVLVAGTALAATGSIWHPDLGRSKPAGAPVPEQQLALLGVLRRPQTEADRSPQVAAALRSLGRAPILNGIHTDAIRVLASTPTAFAALIPVEQVGSARRGQHDVLCLVNGINSPGVLFKGKRALKGWSYGIHCGDTRELQTSGLESGVGGQIMTRAFRPTDRLDELLLVPDGVARIAVRERGGRSVSATVHDNVARCVWYGSPAAMGSVWFDAAGHRIDHRTADVNP